MWPLIYVFVKLFILLLRRFYRFFVRPFLHLYHQCFWLESCLQQFLSIFWLFGICVIFYIMQGAFLRPQIHGRHLTEERQQSDRYRRRTRRKEPDDVAITRTSTAAGWSGPSRPYTFWCVRYLQRPWQVLHVHRLPYLQGVVKQPLMVGGTAPFCSKFLLLIKTV